MRSLLLVLLGVLCTTEAERATAHLRSLRHHHHTKHPMADASPPTLDFSLSCVHDDTVLRNRQTKQLAGTKGHKGSVYAVCLDGTLVCHEEIGVADTPDLADLDCDKIPAHRRLGLLVESPQAQTWPQGVVCFKIAANFTAAQQTQIEHAMTQYRDKTNIRFLDIDACAGVTVRGDQPICGSCRNYINVNNWDEGCFAGVGYQNAGAQVFNLHATCFDDLSGTGRVVHEFGHALGLYHEHSHPARKIVILPGELKVSRNNYQVFTQATTLQYDLASIMHYGTTAGLCLPKDDSIKYCDVSQSPAQDGCVIPTRDMCDEKASEALGQRTMLSPHDLQSITTLYGNVKLSADDEDKLARAAIDVRAKKIAGKPMDTTPPPPPTQDKSPFFTFVADLTEWLS
ncbi:Aste57867_20854 [Aphanomyces stellatus]|uniref:Metalloendopeptidase n=1 Tax=Aphanomyces stellatus TaxID=120398 RepID=A0A485LG08_9STRA|nr:hypothetical protein As57867_020786 [Aphanomyces stellatus]VFT97531.1 Aste57867_20854 [Aphanomyces stellatus]